MIIGRKNSRKLNIENFFKSKYFQNRSCVGRKYAMLKLKVLLSTILRNYKINSDFKEKDFQLQVDIILKRSDGFKIKLEPRIKASA